MSKVSALVSAYYASDYLDQRIQNLFGAKKVQPEIIVVCRRGSAEDKIASGYDVTVVHTNDIPPIGEAWNLAIEHATGDYYTTANTDDRYHIGGLMRMVEVLDNHPEIGLVFAQVDKDDGKHIFPWRRLDRKTGEVHDIKRIIEKRCIIGPMPLWRANIHKRIGYFDETYKVVADYDMWLRMVRDGVRMYYIEDSCGVYMDRPASLEHRNKALCKTESEAARCVTA